jgi:hypothetical protein
MQEVLGLSMRAGCSQRVQGPDEWEVVFQVIAVCWGGRVVVMRSDCDDADAHAHADANADATRC